MLRLVIFFITFLSLPLSLTGQEDIHDVPIVVCQPPKDFRISDDVNALLRSIHQSVNCSRYKEAFATSELLRDFLMEIVEHHELNPEKPKKELVKCCTRKAFGRCAGCTAGWTYKELCSKSTYKYYKTRAKPKQCKKL